MAYYVCMLLVFTYFAEIICQLAQTNESDMSAYIPKVGYPSTSSLNSYMATLDFNGPYDHNQL